MVKTRLLWVICTICEKAGIKSPLNAVNAIDHNPMLICIQKLVIKYDLELRMKQLTVAVSYNCRVYVLAFCNRECEILEFIWELW